MQVVASGFILYASGYVPLGLNIFILVPSRLTQM